MRNITQLLVACALGWLLSIIGLHGGSVVAWGNNRNGQTKTPSNLNIISISAGSHHNIALTEDGHVMAWGGENTTQTNYVGVVPAGLTDVIAISAGTSHNLALRRNGTVVAWGENDIGQCDVPTGLGNVAAIAAGGFHSMALMSNGTVVAWGLNQDGQCNIPFGSNTKIIAIAGGDDHSIALTSEGRIIAWGDNREGQINVPSNIGTNIIAISANFRHNLALTSDGHVIAWGDNRNGQCNVPAVSTFKAISAGTVHSMAVTSSGTVVAWGNNDHGQCNVPGLGSAIAVSGGEGHSLALVGVITTTTKLELLDANPSFISGHELPFENTPDIESFAKKVTSSPARNIAAADGITKLLVRHVSNKPGRVIFNQTPQNPETSGTLTQLDGTVIPALGISTKKVGDEHIAFALYTVPDQIDSENSIIDITALFTGESSTSTSTARLRLIQTPVALVHGLWGNEETWESMRAKLEQANIKAYKIVYHNTTSYAAGPFSEYDNVVSSEIQKFLEVLMKDGIAVTRVDVAGHSMGGILTRMVANRFDFKGPKNFGKGFIRRVITVNTPHWGATSARFLLQAARSSDIIRDTLNFFNRPVDRGAVDDLNPATFAAWSGGPRSLARRALLLPTIAISTDLSQIEQFSAALAILYANIPVGLDYSAYFDHTQREELQSLLCNDRFDTKDNSLTVVNRIFSNRLHDGVVAVDSQMGGGLSTSFSGIEHTKVTESELVQTRIIQLLQDHVTVFGGGLPAVTEDFLNSQLCSPPTSSEVTEFSDEPPPLSPIPFFEWIAPDDSTASGQSGSTVDVKLTPRENIQVMLTEIAIVAGSKVIFWQVQTNETIALKIPIPAELTGSLRISVTSVNNQGEYDIQEKVLNVHPNPALTLISLSCASISGLPEIHLFQLGIAEGLKTKGVYSDGIERDITHKEIGTTYTSDNSAVAIVNLNGQVTATGNGIANITVSNAGLSTVVPVKVALRPPDVLSIEPTYLSTGTTNATIQIDGMNMGGVTNISFLRNGQLDTNISVRSFSVGQNAASIDVQLTISTNIPTGELTAVVSTPVGNSDSTPSQRNQLVIDTPLTLTDYTLQNAPTALKFTLQGPLNAKFILQASSDLKNWTDIFTNTLNQGVLHYTESGTTNFQNQRFYRAQLSP